METNGGSPSNKRKCSETSTTSDDSLEDQLEAIKAKNTRLQKELDARNAADLYVLDTQMESSPTKDDAGDKAMEAEMDRLKEVEDKLRAELDKIHTQIKDERLNYEAEIDQLKSLMETQAEETR